MPGVVVPKNVIMPALGVAQETGRVLQWFKAEGELVSANELLLEIETDKATVELEAPTSGILRDVSARPGDDIPVGTVIAKIWADDEVEHTAVSEGDVSSLVSAHNPEGSHDKRGVEMPSATLTVETHSSESAHSVGGLLASPLGRIPSSPKARRLAAERGIDLAVFAGPGQGRAVLASDVIESEGLKNVRRESQMEVSRVWRGMAERLTLAWNTTPHFYLVREMEAERLVEWRQALQARCDQKITFSDLLVKKVANCLQSHPQLNSEWRDGGLVYHAAINIGLAVATEKGLVVPVIRDAERLTVEQIGLERSRLVGKAQEASLTVADISDGTFTISNLGMFGVDSFQAIVNPPQAAILAVGRVSPRVIAINNEPAVRPMVTFSLSCDHRAIDGARAAQFLAALAVSVEQASPLET
jgi:pyruvate dehydrogenase E2 component (dihydrolipoamide acetyltransferase)